MAFSEVKKKFDEDLEKFAKLKKAERDVLLQAWQLRLQFELYGELNSLAVNVRKLAAAYEKMADLTEKRMKQ
jgi:hypothetical protein